MKIFKFTAMAAFMLVLTSLHAQADGVGEMQRLITQQNTASAQVIQPAAQPAPQPAAVKNTDSDTIRLTPDSTKVIHLDQDAASVLVANPQHASVLLDNPRLIVVMPKQPGSTSLTVLDANGRTIMEKRILITGTQSKYVRVRRMCGNDNNCAPSSYFYCPDGCYEVAPVPASNTMGDIPEVQGSPSPAAQDQVTPQPAPPELPDAAPANEEPLVIPPAREPQ